MRASPFKPSPQVVPLESRIHLYLLRNHGETVKATETVENKGTTSVDELFSTYNFAQADSERDREPEPTTATAKAVRIYESLESEGFFIEALASAQRYSRNAPSFTKLSVLAQEYCPNKPAPAVATRPDIIDKENLHPNLNRN
jgi:hypothetical protein